MVNNKLDGVYLSCDKCGRHIKIALMVSFKFVEKYKKKKIYCGRCIQKRLHRNDQAWDYDKEFNYEIKPLSKEDERTLELLRLISF